MAQTDETVQREVQRYELEYSKIDNFVDELKKLQYPVFMGNFEDEVKDSCEKLEKFVKNVIKRERKRTHEETGEAIGISSSVILDKIIEFDIDGIVLRGKTKVIFNLGKDVASSEPNESFKSYKAFLNPKSDFSDFYFINPLTGKFDILPIIISDLKSNEKYQYNDTDEIIDFMKSLSSKSKYYLKVTKEGLNVLDDFFRLEKEILVPILNYYFKTEFHKITIKKNGCFIFCCGEKLDVDEAIKLVDDQNSTLRSEIDYAKVKNATFIPDAKTLYESADDVITGQLYELFKRGK